MKRQLILLPMILGALALAGAKARVDAATFDVDVDAYTLYTDPNTGNEVKLGGFSGLYPAGEFGLFYVVTDRGPSYDYIVVDADGVEDDLEYKVFLAPEFGPHLVKLQLFPDLTAQVVDGMPLLGGGGGEISGFPNTSPTGLVDPFLQPLDNADADGLDAEGLTRDGEGYFWVSEEYRPSIARISPATGEVVLRLVPEGTLTGLETVTTLDVLPGILSKRVDNRGLEGVAFAHDGNLYAVMQRPLANPNKATSEASQNTRLLAIDLAAVLAGETDGVVRQLLFRNHLIHRSDYAADLFPVQPKREAGETPKTILLVPERRADKLFAVEVSGATDITSYEDEDGRLLSDPSKTVEMLDHTGLATLGIKPVKKILVLDSLTAIHPSLDKCEGVCLVGDILFLTADNDFNLSETVVLDTEVSVPIPVNLQDPVNLPAIHMVPLPNPSVLR